MKKNTISQTSLIIGLLILNTLVISCATAQKVTIVEGTFTHPFYKWSLSHLDGWKIKESHPSDVIFVAERQQMMISVRAIPVNSGNSLDNVASYVLNTWPPPHFRLISGKTITLKNGLPALEIIHHIGTGMNGKSRKIIVIVNGQGFLIDAETFFDSWDASELYFEKIINSFTLSGGVEGQKPGMEADYLYVLAAIYGLGGKYVEAESPYKQSLEIRQKTLGSDHLDVAASLYGLAVVYAEQNKYAEAEPLYKQSVEIREKTLGPDHPDVAASLYSLALVYKRQGKYAEAEPLYKRSLEIMEKAYGQDHPYMANPYYGLGSLYNKQGKYAEAEPLYKRSLEIMEKAYGPDNRNLLLCLTGLAEVYEAQGKHAEAELLYKRKQDIVDKMLKIDHP